MHSLPINFEHKETLDDPTVIPFLNTSYLIRIITGCSKLERLPFELASNLVDF